MPHQSIVARIARVGDASDERRITVLDGWRGVSILLVVCGHLINYRYAPAYFASGGPAQSLVLTVSVFGVCIFFVISGLIITTLAIREREQRGSFSARSFYLRRFFRIVPPFYLYLAIVLLLASSGVIGHRKSETLGAAAFLCNLPQVECGWFVAHSWSLAYEEQFYVLFPCWFILCGKRVRPLLMALLSALLAVPVMRYVLGPTPMWHAIHQLTWYFSFMAAGSLVAASADWMQKLNRSVYAPYLSWGAAFVLLVLILFDGAAAAHPGAHRLEQVHVILSPVFEPLCTAWLVGTSLQRANWMTRLLHARPLLFLGTISYSLYLWQQLFTAAPSRYLLSSPLPLAPMMLVCATLSYYFVERPAQRLGKQAVRVLLNAPRLRRAMALGG